MRKLLPAIVVVAALLPAAPAEAITFGQLDGNRHPYVGALIADWNPEVPGQDLLCSGTLISPTVFLTASHCTAFLPDVGVDPDEVFVTFDPEPVTPNGAVLPTTTLLPGTYHTNPEFGFSGSGGFSDPHDMAVVVLDAPHTGATPARLPTLNFLDTIGLEEQRFTAVGYGDVREDKRTGLNALVSDGKRRFVTQGFHTLTKSWLKLSMNPSTGSGGTCYGDSGGPHFLGDTNLVVSITVTGDTPCRATDVTYRTDTASARAFLGQFVTLP
jgi:Trypsin